MNVYPAHLKTLNEKEQFLQQYYSTLPAETAARLKEITAKSDLFAGPINSWLEYN
jgi:hypothetical protein